VETVSGAVMVIDRVMVALLTGFAASVADTSKPKMPVCVGVPEIAPVAGSMMSPGGGQRHGVGRVQQTPREDGGGDRQRSEHAQAQVDGRLHARRRDVGDLGAEAESPRGGGGAVQGPVGVQRDPRRERTLRDGPSIGGGAADGAEQCLIV
jgi:hypothetical protein